jgi:hypothetical protein
MIMLNGVVVILVVFWILLSSILGLNDAEGECIRKYGRDWDYEANACPVTESYYWTEKIFGVRTHHYKR